MFGGVVVVVVVVVDSSSFVFKSPRQTSAWGPGKKRGRRFKRPREKKTLPPSASSSPLPSRLKMRVAGQSPTHGQSEARRGVTAPACKRPAPAVRQWSGVAGVSRAARPPPKTSSTEAFWAHKGLFFFVLVPVVGAKVEIGPHFFFFGPFPFRDGRVAVAFRSLDPAVVGRCRRRCDPYLSVCASLPANARDVDNPADQNLTLFHLPLVRSHRERLDLLQALTSPWPYWAQRRAGQAGLNCDDPYHDSRGQDRGHCRTRPSVSVAVARRGPAVFWFWRCRCKAWPSITTRTWLRGNLGESKIRRGRETRERVDLWVWVWVWVRDGPSSDLFLETTTSQVPRKDSIHLHHDCILSECFLMAAEC